MKRLTVAAIAASLSFALFSPAHARLADTVPLIVRADNEATVTLTFENEPLLAKPDDVQAEYVCADGLDANGVPLGYGRFQPLPCEIRGNTLTVTVRFRGETEHAIRVIQKSSDPKKPNVLGVARLYSLRPDYFALRPYRGDMHMHSKFSDGDKNESPALMIATCRKLGQDFAIETDHHAYAGSLDAIAAFSKLPTDMKTFPGEEVHSPGNGVHILSLGASESMTDWFNNSRAEYDQAVAAERAKLPDTVPDHFKHHIAASFAVWDKIRACGGIAVFCHPYWRPAYRQYIPAIVSDYLLETAKFDAMEVLNGGSSELSTLHYNELRAQGKLIAGIGVTDAHSSKSLGCAYTLILAEQLDFPSLAKNIRLRNCAAVDIDPVSKRQTVIGEFRFSRYAIFLLKQFFPLQDDICRQEGEWLLKALEGDAQAIAALKASQGTTPALRTKYWQK
jgi:predicted metal-dependent phosphoesterase TrpH